MTEKGQQVSLMGQLFKQTTRVLICVGSNNDGHAERFSSLLGELDDMVLKGIKKARPSSDTFPRLDLESKERLLSDEIWHAIRALGRLPWFGRGWVVQEAGLSNNAIIVWGEVEISWTKFLRAWVWMSWRLEALFRKYPDIDRLSLLHTDSYIARNSREVISILPRNIYLSKTSLDFLQILNPARLLGIKLDHDRVYAFLSVATGATGRIDLQPDYTVPAVDIYADVARQYLRAARDVNLLRFVQHNDSTIIQTNVPSWVPLWDLNLFDIAVFNLSLSTCISLSLP